MPFRFTPLTLPGVILIEPRVFSDTRGFFMETYRRSDFVAAGIADTFVQENQSRSLRGTLRGLHFQRAPSAQGKLVRVVGGAIFDVVVDLRVDQPTFGRWLGVTLTAAEPQILFVPPWCAHGFCVVSDDADVHYKTTAEYAPEHECGIAWNDETLAIDWPITDPILSERDRGWPSLRETVRTLQELGQ
jgi:dTDP-4-dehydrorhamnose 3,5-epimerase